MPPKHKIPFNPFSHLDDAVKPVTKTRRETLMPLFAAVGAVCAICKTKHATAQAAHECERMDRDQLGAQFDDDALFHG